MCAQRVQLKTTIDGQWVPLNPYTDCVKNVRQQMPLAGSKLLGTTVLYVGPTTDTYSTGVCYTCKATDASSYYWEAVASGGGEYTLTKEAVDGVIGASAEGSTAKFYNEQGAFTEVDMSGYLPLSGGNISGRLQINHGVQLFILGTFTVSSAATFTVNQNATFTVNSDATFSRAVRLTSSASYIQFASGLINFNGSLTIGSYTRVGSSGDVPNIDNTATIQLTNGQNKGRLELAVGSDIDTINSTATARIKMTQSDLSVCVTSSIFTWNGNAIATVNDISTHNTDTTAHANLFALKVDAQTYNTDITAINTALDGKENTGVAQGLVDAHNESATAHEALFEVKADKTELDAYLPLSGGTMTGNVFWNSETGFGVRHKGTNVNVGWSFDDHTGSGIGFRAVDYTSNPGGFSLFARNDTDGVVLDGFADGRLQWGGQSVLNPIGTVIAFAGNSAPAGYLICNGAAVSRTTYAKLFAIIGTTYGEGDGSTTFNMPNLTNKFIMGSGTAGTNKAAGVPDIDGAFVLRRGGSSGTVSLRMASSGAFSANTTDTTESAIIWNATSYSSAVIGTNFTFKASRYSSVYKDDITTVQPPALTMRFYIKY